MLIDRQTLPDHLPWIVTCIVATAVCAWWYFMPVYQGSLEDPSVWPGGSSVYGLVFGFTAGLIILFEFALWPRKLLRRWRIGSARTWMRAHIWLGLLTVPLLVMHSGFQVRGPLAMCLSILFVIVILSGIFGLVLQQRLPKMMLDTVAAETVFTQIDTLSTQFVSEAEEIVAAVCGGREDAAETVLAATVGTGGVQVVGALRKPARILKRIPALRPVPGAEPLREAFQETIRPYLLRQGPVAELRDEARAKLLFDGLRAAMPADGHTAVRALEECCEHRRQFDRQARLHWWLHSWMAIHLPLSAALVILMIVHAWFGLMYMTS